MCLSHSSTRPPPASSVWLLLDCTVARAGEVLTASHPNWAQILAKSRLVYLSKPEAVFWANKQIATNLTPRSRLESSKRQQRKEEV